MKRKIKAGTTSHIEPIRVYDSSSTTGGYLASLVYNTSGLTGKYRREGDANWTAITLVAATAGTFASGGWAVPGGTGPTGSYEVHIPNAALASGAKWVEIEYYGATNMLPVAMFFELDAVDYQDTVRFGLTAMPNVASGNAGALLVDGSGTAAIATSAGVVSTVGQVSGNVGGNVAGSVGSVTAAVTVGTNNDKTGYSLTQSFPSNFAALGINASGHVSRVTLVDTTTTNTDMRGTDSAYTGTPPTAASIADAVWDEATSGHATAGSTGAALTSAGSAGDPWGTALPGAYASGTAGHYLGSAIPAKTNLITASTVTVSSPVTATGKVNPIVIGDDYLSANGRAFTWTITAPTGFVVGTSTCKFGGLGLNSSADTWNITGTVTDAGGGSWTLSFDMTKTISGALSEGLYKWSVEVASAEGVEHTVMRWGSEVEVVAKQT